MPPSNPLVLVADDEPTMLELVTRHLKTMHDPKLEVIEASDGEQAWRLALERLPDLVVLDVMMPGMSGWEVCRKIRQSVALAHTGVVMLTGIGEPVNQLTSPLYGADAYIDKPFDFQELDRKVKDALEARASQREAVARPVTNGTTATPRVASDAAPRERHAGRAAPRKKAAKKAASTTSKASSAARTSRRAAPKRSAVKTARKTAAKTAPRGAKAAATPAKGTTKKKSARVAAKKAKRPARRTSRK